MANKLFEGKIPPLKLWRDSGKHPPGPTELQRMYFIDKLPPEERPHLHPQDQIFSVGGQGSSKCFRKGTPVLSFDGSVVKIEDVKVGDLLMGPDSKPRTVLSLGRGREAMYEVKPVKGEPFYCNESHILSLKRSSNKGDLKWISPEGVEYRKPNPRYPRQEVVNVPIKEYLDWSKRKKSRFLLYRAETINFPTKAPLLIDPYILGVWLGDGHKHNFTVTSADQEIVSSLEDYAKSLGKDLIKFDQRENCANYRITYETDNLKALGVQHNKHIPQIYKTAPVEDRRQLLAGLIDTDGTMRGNCFHITQKIKVLAEDIAFLARSLGLAAYIKERQCYCIYKGEKKGGTYYQVNISGELDQIPTRLPRKQATPRKQKKSALVTGFKLTKLPPEDYYGVTVDSDSLYLLGDFTVVHNTYGGVIRLIDTCATTPGTVAYLGGMDFKLLKRNTWGTIQDVFTINEPWDHPAVLNRLHDQNNELKFRNGSKLVCINLEQHLDKKIGYTAGIQMIDEVHLLPDVGAYNLIVGRNRGYPPEISQLIMCTNPQRSKEGWTNEQFELHRFEGIDTSEHPHQILIGNPCKCHVCTKCRLFKKKEVPWEQTGEDVYQCPACKSFRDFYTWKGKKYHCPGNQQYVRVIKSESGHNPHLRDDYFQGMEDAYDEVYFDIMVRGTVNINLRDDYCYKKYDEEIHELPLQMEINWDQDIYWSLDFNKKPQASVLCQFEYIDGQEKFIVKEEISLAGKPTIEFPRGRGEGATSLDVAKYFVDKYKSRYQGTTIHVYGDPHAFTSTVTSSQNSFEIVCGYLEENGFYVNLVADKHQISVKDRLELVDYWLDQQLILFNPSSVLPWTTRSFKESKLDDNDEGKGEKVSKKQDWNAARSTNMNKVYCTSHFNEALGYLIWKLFPMTGMEMRAATLPDGTTIKEDRRGKVIVEKNSIDLAPEEGSYEYLLQKMKHGEEAGAQSFRQLSGIRIGTTRWGDDTGE